MYLNGTSIGNIYHIEFAEIRPDLDMDDADAYVLKVYYVSGRIGTLGGLTKATAEAALTSLNEALESLQKPSKSWF